MTPASAVIEVGDSLTVRLWATKLDGSQVPVASPTFAITDPQGQPSSLATIDAQGHLTAASAGKIRVIGTVAGAAVQPQSVEITIYAAVSAGRRVVVLDAATRAPIEGATVRACSATGCSAPEIVLTDTSGAAAFTSLGTAPADVSVIAPMNRSVDGLPMYERVTALSTQATSLLVPLRPNPVHAAAGISATIAFNQVHSNGSYWTGFPIVSFTDPLQFSPAALLGDNFWTELPALSQRVPIPASITLYTSIGFGVGQEVKPRSLSTAEAGTRRAVAFAGRASQAQALTLRSLDLLSYLGAFDFDVNPPWALENAAKVSDANDVDNDGLCANTQRCPMGSEEVPDYARFTPAPFAPRREQLLRTEIQLAPLPPPFDRVVVAQLAMDKTTGLLPLGLTTQVATSSTAAGRTIEPFVLRSGAPYGDLAVAPRALLALAQSANAEVQSGRLTASATVPSKVVFKPFLPALDTPSYSPSNRTLQPHQPDWAAAASAGAEMGRLTLTGSQTTHCYYFPHTAQMTAWVLPALPAGTLSDPSEEASARISLSAVDLVDGLSVDEVLSFQGINLLNLGEAIDGFASVER